MSDWNQKDIIKYRHATLHDLKKAQRHENDYTILDIRNKNEWENGVFQGNLVKVPLIELEKQV
jgi:rhodanese-related sulfurtransferase